MIAVSVHTGRTLGGRWTIIRRDEQPGLFWAMIGVYSAFLIVFVFLGLMAIAPWSAGSENWAAPNINPNTSLSRP